MGFMAGPVYFPPATMSPRMPAAMTGRCDVWVCVYVYVNVGWVSQMVRIGWILEWVYRPPRTTSLLYHYHLDRTCPGRPMMVMAR